MQFGSGNQQCLTRMGFWFVFLICFFNGFFFFLISAKHCFRPFTVFKAFFSPSSTMLRPGFRSPQENTSCNSLSVTSESSESESETQSGAWEGVCPSHCVQVHIHRRKSSSPRPPHLEKGAPGHRRLSAPCPPAAIHVDSMNGF